MMRWVKPAIGVVSFLVIVVLFILGPERLVRTVDPQTDKVPTSKLSGLFSEIKIHSGDQWSGTPSSFDKEILTGVSARILSKLPPREIVSYYASSLPSGGWVKAESSSGKENTLKFCKGRASLTVEALPEGTGTDYYLGVNWSSQAMGPFYCP